MFARRRGVADADDVKNFLQFFQQFVRASGRSNLSTRGCRAKSASGCAEKSRREIVRCGPRRCAIGKPAPPPRCDDVRRRCREMESAANCVSMNLISSALEIVHDEWRTPSLAGEIHVGRFGNFLRDKLIQCRRGAIRQKNRAGLRIQRFDVAHAVVFLVRAREFVFLDDARPDIPRSSPPRPGRPAHACP